MIHYAVYALVDPRNQECRYIGLTTNFSRRMIEHKKASGRQRRRNGLIQINVKL